MDCPKVAITLHFGVRQKQLKVGRLRLLLRLGLPSIDTCSIGSDANLCSSYSMDG